MRLGGPTFQEYSDPPGWVQAVRACGYTAAYCPIGPDAPPDVVKAYADAAAAADIVIAEVGAWSHLLSGDAAEHASAMDTCRGGLALADAIGARCCVNIAGSRGVKWDGPCPQDMTDETFDMIVQSVQSIIDDVAPTRSYYTLETMPWMYPDSPDSYLKLIEAIDRKQFAVHLDPVNLICSPQRYFNNAAVIKECFAKLGPRIRSCHAKDILLGDQLTVHLDEVIPGGGGLDYHVFLTELAKLDDDTPLMLEHLGTEAEYTQAAAHIRQVAEKAGVQLR